MLKLSAFSTHTHTHALSHACQWCNPSMNAPVMRLTHC